MLFSRPPIRSPWISAFRSASQLPLSRPRFFSISLSRYSVDMETVNTSERLSRLRELMQEHKVDVYIVPSEDSHQSEYIAPCDGRREFISGFSGSAGTAIVSLSKAALSTDGRYFNQASKQLDNNWQLLKRGVEGFPTWQEWYDLSCIYGLFRIFGLSMWLGLPNRPKAVRSLVSTQL